MKTKTIIIGNWKMAPATLKEAKNTFNGIKKTASKLRNVQTVLCPPSIYLSELIGLVSGHRLVVGAQDVFEGVAEASTGEVSATMLTALGAKYVIVGHSERRAFGEDNELVRKKLNASLKAGLVVVLCVGEIERDAQSKYISFIKEELKVALKGLKKDSLKNVVIAYEPIWAIGKNAKRPASSADALEMSLLIKQVLSDLFGKAHALSVPVLYGGSVGPQNTEGFLTEGGMDGLLVGRASRDVEKFSAILNIANEI